MIRTLHDTTSKFEDLNMHFEKFGDLDDTRSQVRRPTSDGAFSLSCITNAMSYILTCKIFVTLTTYHSK